MKSTIDQYIRLAVGTYTVGTASKGVYFLDINLGTKEIVTIRSVSAANPSFIKRVPNSNYLLCCEEVGSSTAKLKVIDLVSLTVLSEKLIEGSGACHVEVDSYGRNIIVSNYSSGSFSKFKIDEQGSLSDLIDHFSFKDTSSHPTRQLRSHIHSAFYTPKNNLFFVQNLGGDLIYQFTHKSFHQKNAPYTPFKLENGSGPRHITFGNNNAVYILNELDGSIAVCTLNDQEEIDSLIQKVPLSTSNDVNGLAFPAEIRVNSTSTFLYSSSRGKKNEINVYKIEPNKHLSFVQKIASGGESPRNFNFSIDEKYLFVANQLSNQINVFEIDPDSGILTSEDFAIVVPSPSCVCPF